MAVKARNRKRNERLNITLNAVRIKCCYCDIKDTCKRREFKEKNEMDGIRTSCMITPNVPRSKARKIAKARNRK